MENTTPTTLAKSYEFKSVEKKWYDTWLEQKQFAAKMNPEAESFSIVIPPPNVTGVLHVGHALNNTLQDVLVRYKRMMGFNTLWVPGTDHAGIATQNVVERQLATEGKGRHDLGREAFIERVWQWKEEKGGTIINQLKHLGSSCDWERERFTMDEGLSKAVRTVFVRLYKEGLIYRGDYIVNWCPRCHTALADDEVEHVDKKGALYHIRYPYADGSGHVVVATTRPETMLGDTAVAVHPEDKRYKGLAEIGVKLPLTDRVLPVVFDHHVKREFGTGALKVTPAHDRDDYEIGMRHNLEIIKVMDESGNMNELAGPYVGLDRFQARKQIVADLKAQGFLVEIEDYDHAVGHCYRCQTVVEPTTSLQWFVSVKPLADRAVQAVQDGRMHIHPKSWNNSFYAWMDNIRDWCISRQIWWGHQIPAWTCDDCGEMIVEEEVPTSCSKCKGDHLTQETDVLDTWFSSALWPFSTLGWPEKTEELKFFYPTSVLITSFDILFFWVARMMMMGLHFMDEVPFKDVYLHALVRDKEGKKMSKSTGNVLDPLVVIDEYGTDALRYTMVAFAAQGRDIRLSEERIEGYRNFMNKIWNAARFSLMHISDCDPTITSNLDPNDLKLEHQWILSRLNKAIDETHQSLEDFRFNDTASVIYQFIWHEFCDWYLELVKADLYGDDEAAQQQARRVLFTVLEQSLRLMHPVAPFITEEIWHSLPGPRASIMEEKYPMVNAEWADQNAEESIDLLMGIVGGVRNIRSEMQIHPSAEITAFIICSDTTRAAQITKQTNSISNLTRLSALTVLAEGSVPEDAASYIYQDLEIYIPLKGLIDVEKELAKLEKSKLKLEKQFTQTSGKLKNEKFLANAPDDVVAKEHAKLDEFTLGLAKIGESSARLEKLR
ncbi:MAG: valine--tRNA ligase [Desulfobulbaceae bacterium]|jgi:valyl-tRNA synthetase|nr:valine--tRNA ligase [Desulfobulbaceae bacterium]